MRFLIIMFLILFLYALLFARIKINGAYAETFLQRVYVSVVGSFLLTIFMGIPLLGIITLIKGLVI